MTDPDRETLRRWVYLWLLLLVSLSGLVLVEHGTVLGAIGVLIAGALAVVVVRYDGRTGP